MLGYVINVYIYIYIYKHQQRYRAEGPNLQGISHQFMTTNENDDDDGGGGDDDDDHFWILLSGKPLISINIQDVRTKL